MEAALVSKVMNCVWVLGSDPWPEGIPPSPACSLAPGGRTYVVSVPPSTRGSARKISGDFGTWVLWSALPEPMESLFKNKDRQTQNN